MKRAFTVFKIELKKKQKRIVTHSNAAKIKTMFFKHNLEKNFQIKQLASIVQEEKARYPL